ncbi:hypothetical protein DTO013E5_10224 [Penicillium roqueforti]|uniref:Uncharacterized protein n=2 Tax=Penicillium TaxID=5073 RepID=A0A1V6WZP7_PENNA|nr:hypothetical protein DTO013F2_10491 [Penicillium roqueforti]OQE68308.1 hypothetical protein PENNAL_c0157G11718 [Penicillium nalgiovense]CAG8018721.1 unnamed protein product [Penicillium salamii]KAI2734039.1 hypothetical protein DTO012A1_10254 [Penicillium roqueforti]KAI3195038.1 hypothetical protein DTO013E5_10224 [Penicillium roqueforti]
MENPRKSPEVADGHGKAAPGTQINWTEDAPMPSHEVQQPSVTEKDKLAVEPFQPVLEILKQLEEEDPKLAFQAARLVGLYRRLWESCVSKHVDSQQIEAANEKLRTGNIQLCNEGNHLKHRQDEQVARLHAIDDALDEVRGKLIGVLKVWNERSVGELAILPEDEFPRR